MDSILVHIGAGHSILVVLLVDENVFLVRVDMALLGLCDDVAQRDDVGHKSQCTDEDHHLRVGRHNGRIHCGAHNAINGSLSAGSIELFDSSDTIRIETSSAEIPSRTLLLSCP